MLWLFVADGLVNALMLIQHSDKDAGSLARPKDCNKIAFFEDTTYEVKQCLTLQYIVT